jgi:glycosyltransferase involved in cell wall biosynthesis
MRVLLSSQEMPPETGWGGIGTYVATLAPALAAAGAEVRVLSVVRGQESSDRERDGVVIHRRPLRRPPGIARLTRLPQGWERLSLALAVDREVRRLRLFPDVIEAPEWRAEGLVLARRRTAPVLVRLHSAAQQLFPYANRVGFDTRAAVRLERLGIDAADLVVSTRSNLDSLSSIVRGRMPPARAIALPVPQLAPAGPPPATPRVLFVGRLERRKGPELLVEAARAVLEAVPEARFAFAGADTGRAPGSYLELMRGRARELEVEHALEFLGQLGHAQVLDEIRAATVCAFPSRQETFGYGAAEAAALGRAVVGSRIPPYEELFGAREGVGGADGAVLVPVEDVPAWAAAITALLRDTARTEALGRAGRARVTDRCAPDRIAAEMLDAYAEAARLAGVRMRARPRSRGRR